MRKRWHLCLILFMSVSTSVFSQTLTSKIHYQASVRRLSGLPFVSRPVSVRIEIVDSAGSTVFYTERHAVITDPQGIFSLAIGGGTPITGNISTLPWGSGRKYLRTAIDTAAGTNYAVMGSTEMLSVPYAQYALTAGESATAHLKGTGNLWLGDSSLANLTTGSNNIALGVKSLLATRTGSDNLAIGANSGAGVSGSRNLAIGQQAMSSHSTSDESVAVGFQSLQNNIGSANTALGTNSLQLNTTGINNVAIGNQALGSNTTGQYNTAVGYGSLANAGPIDHVVMIGANAGRNAKSNYNVGVGSDVMLSLSTGMFNVAVGNTALASNTSGSRNVGIGQIALTKNTLAENNTAVGYGTLVENTIGNSNSAFGTYSLDANVNGNENAAFGRHSLQDNVSGSGNTSIGTESMYLSVSGFWNTALGYQSQYNNATGSENTSIGTRALSTNVGGVGLVALGAGSDVASGALTNSSVMGHNARVSTSHTMSFGNASVTKWAFGLPTTAHTLQVGSNSSNGNGAYLTVGGAWTNASSIDLKEDFEVVPSEELLEKIDSLDVLKWRYKGTDETHIGPMAESFKRLFGLGAPGDDKHIGTVDANGIALRAIQVLREKLSAAERDRMALEERVRTLETMVKGLLEERIHGDGAGRTDILLRPVTR